MKLVKNTPAAVIGGIVSTAVRLSRETRERVATELRDVLLSPRRDAWLSLLAERSADRGLVAAARTLPRLASPTLRPFVRRAVGRLLEALGDLAAWCPEYAQRTLVVPERVARRVWGGSGFRTRTWSPTAESVTRLDELRAVVYVRLVEVQELFADHPDPLARVCTVARRIAGVVLPPTTAAVVGEWFGRLATGDRAAG